MPSGGRRFWWVLAVASTVMSTLAIVSLARHAFPLHSLSAPMSIWFLLPTPQGCDFCRDGRSLTCKGS